MKIGMVAKQINSNNTGNCALPRARAANPTNRIMPIRPTSMYGVCWNSAGSMNEMLASNIIIKVSTTAIFGARLVGRLARRAPARTGARKLGNHP